MKKLFSLLAALWMAAAMSPVLAEGVIIQKTVEECCLAADQAQRFLYSDDDIQIRANAFGDNGLFDGTSAWQVFEKDQGRIFIDTNKDDRYLWAMTLTFTSTNDAVLMCGNDTVKSGVAFYTTDFYGVRLYVRGKGNNGRINLTAFSVLYDNETARLDWCGVPSEDGDTLNVSWGMHDGTVPGLVPYSQWKTDEYVDWRDQFIVIKILPNKAIPTTTDKLFYGFRFVKTIEGMENLNTSECTNMQAMFYNCQSLETLDLSHFNTEKACYMSAMFAYCTSLKELDLRTFNTRYVDNMEGMFLGCDKLSNILFGPEFVTYNVKRMNYMFSGCKSLGELSLTQFNTGNVKYMDRMFKDCTNLRTLDISNFSIYSLESTKEMFSGCFKLRNIVFTGDMSVQDNITDSEDMFDGCGSLVGEKGTGTNYNPRDKSYARLDMGPDSDQPGYFCSTPLELYGVFSNDGKKLTLRYDRRMESYNAVLDWRTDEYAEQRAAVKTVHLDPSMDNASPDNICRWFQGFTNLQTFNHIEYLFTGFADSANYMFDGCESLQVLDLSYFDHTALESIEGMFRNCKNLKTIYSNNAWTTARWLTNSDNMFEGCTSLTGEFGTTYSESNPKDVTYAHPDDVNESNKGYFTPRLQELYGSFAEYEHDMYRCTLYYDNHKYIKTGYTPNEWTSDDFIPIRTKVKKVIFDETVQEARPTSTTLWFYQWSELREIEHLDYLNTSEVTSMYAMFANCEKLTSLDIRHFDVSKVTDMWYMFYNCYSLDYILCADNWSSILSAKNAGEMFTNCYYLQGQAGTHYIEGHNDNDITFALPDGGENYPGYFSAEVPELLYGVLSDDGETLVLRYDNRFTDNNGMPLGELFLSGANKTVKKAVFDESMRDKRPRSTRNLFNGFYLMETIEHLDHLNTSEVIDMTYMFAGCRSLPSLDVSHFDISKVTSVYSMFSSCSELTAIYCDKDWSSLADADIDDRYMFYECPRLVGGKGTAFDDAHINISYARPDEGVSAPGYFTLIDKPTGVSGVQEDKPQCTKVLRNGILYILRDGKTYNAQGATVK